MLLANRSRTIIRADQSRSAEFSSALVEEEEKKNTRELYFVQPPSSLTSPLWFASDGSHPLGIQKTVPSDTFKAYELPWQFESNLRVRRPSSCISYTKIISFFEGDCFSIKNQLIALIAETSYYKLLLAHGASWMHSQMMSPRGSEFCWHTYAEHITSLFLVALRERECSSIRKS